MKIDKRNLSHWSYLARSGFFALVGILLRSFWRPKEKLVVLYGHKFNGNIRAFAEYLKESKVNDGLYSVAYATMDPEYYKAVKAQYPDANILSMIRLKDMIAIARSSAIITTHGLHTLVLFRKFTGIKFINVWHGIGWKGHDSSDFSFTEGYADNWVSSEVFRGVYENYFKVKTPVHVTGYARSDDAVNKKYSVAELRKKYGISRNFKKVILIAPTWEQGSGNHSIYPFGQDSDSFFAGLDEAAKGIGALVIFRSHLNSKTTTLPSGLNNIVLMPYREYPVVEDFLYMADMLISDWSSIVFDYLPLRRPTIFLDVKCPYDKVCIGESNRFGVKVSSMKELTSAMQKYTLDPKAYEKKYGAKMAEAENTGYGSTLDGKSSERYHKRLIEIIGE